LLHLLTAANGTTRTSRSSLDMSVHWGDADSPPMIASWAVHDPNRS
jgi:hypothetical protein